MVTISLDFSSLVAIVSLALVSGLYVKLFLRDWQASEDIATRLLLAANAAQLAPGLLEAEGNGALRRRASHATIASDNHVARCVMNVPQSCTSHSQLETGAAVFLSREGRRAVKALPPLQQ